VPGPREQLGERLGVRGPARLGALGARHAELVEEHLLELLRAGEVDLLADHGVRLPGRCHHPARELLLQGPEEGLVDGDARRLHVLQGALHGELEVRQERGRAPLVEVVREPRGQVVHGAGPGEGLGTLGEVEHAVGLARRELPAEVAADEVRQVVVALPRRAQVGGERGVEGDAGKPDPAPAQGVPGGLRVVHRLRGRRGEPGPHGGDVVALASEVHARRPSGVRERDAPGVGPVADDVHRDHATGRREEACDVARLVPLHGLHGRSRVPAPGQDAEHPVAQDAELERREEVLDRLPVPGAPVQLVRPHRQLQVGQEVVQATVAHDVGEVGAQRLTGPAGHRVDRCDEAVQSAVLAEPLGRRLRAHAGHAGEVVGGLAHEGG